MSDRVKAGRVRQAVAASTTGGVTAASARGRAPPSVAALRPNGPSVAAPALPELADVEEVAAWLRTTPKAIYAMIERAQLPGVIRIGRRVLFDRAALVHWLSERRVPSPQETRR